MKVLGIVLTLSFSAIATEYYNPTVSEAIPYEKITGEKFLSIKFGDHFFIVDSVYHDPMCPCSDEQLTKLYEIIDSN